jgi:hypothetical protein
MNDRFGEYIDAQQRLLAAGYILSTSGDMVLGYTVVATRPGDRPRTASGRTLSHTTIRLADRLAPGAK